MADLDSPSASWPFPCPRCDRTEGCPCITGEIEVRRARTAVTARHHASVARARTTTRHRRAA